VNVQHLKDITQAGNNGVLFKEFNKVKFEMFHLARGIENLEKILTEVIAPHFCDLQSDEVQKDELLRILRKVN
jgi:hypothetical protein